MQLDKGRWTQVYRTMVLIREFEDVVLRLAQEGKVRGSLHFQAGQEAVAAGSCAALREDDYMTTTYRGHGHILAKGVAPGPIIAELMGKRTGLCKGKGGKLHLTDVSKGVLGANGVVAAGIPMAAGAALRAQMDGTGQIAITFFGDGATNQGVFHETLNLAAVWNLPVIFVCENNLYSEMTPIRDMVRVKQLADRAAAYGIEGVVIDGNDPLVVYEAVARAAEKARRGGGPTFIEAMTYRLVGHMYGDAETYRTKEEVAQWRQRDPIVTFRRRLLEEKVATEQELEEIHREVAAVLAEAVRFAEESPFPDPEEVIEDVYAEPLPEMRAWYLGRRVVGVR